MHKDLLMQLEKRIKPLDLIEALEAKDEKDYISGWDEIRKGVEAGSHDFVHGVGTILFAGTDLHLIQIF